jgi:hypothetical protein
MVQDLLLKLAMITGAMLRDIVGGFARRDC